MWWARSVPRHAFQVFFPGKCVPSTWILGCNRVFSETLKQTNSPKGVLQSLLMTAREIANLGCFWYAQQGQSPVLPRVDSDTAIPREPCSETGRYKRLTASADKRGNRYSDAPRRVSGSAAQRYFVAQ